MPAPKMVQLGQTVKVTGKVSLAAVKATKATKATAPTKTKSTAALPARAWGGVARTGGVAGAGAATKAATKAGGASAPEWRQVTCDCCLFVSLPALANLVRYQFVYLFDLRAYQVTARATLELFIL